jgi:hypothetical protein
MHSFLRPGSLGLAALGLALSSSLAARAQDAAPPAAPAAPAAPAEDQRPLSPAQIALFETPHLRNVQQPETLSYRYLREGPAAFTDTVAVHVRQVNADGTKDLSFDYLTGDRRVGFPELDHFRGNPLLMQVLERDVDDMKGAVGISSSWFRNRIREAFVDQAEVADATTEVGGAAVPARRITVRPYAHEERLARIRSLQEKTYSFVLADSVPGMIAEIDIDTPADAAMQAPAMSEKVVFEGVTP